MNTFVNTVNPNTSQFEYMKCNANNTSNNYKQSNKTARELSLAALGAGPLP
jgi:hypothetical protein